MTQVGGFPRRQRRDLPAPGSLSRQGSPTGCETRIEPALSLATQATALGGRETMGRPHPLFWDGKGCQPSNRVETTAAGASEGE